MNFHCPACARPLGDQPTPSIVHIRFCSRDCITAWFALGRHQDRRHRFEVVYPDRRAAS
jgi:hypothetical protein